jgi:uncharacterized protein YcfJ
MFKKSIIGLVSSSLVFALSGCASQSTWTPNVDLYGDPRPERLTADVAECKQVALQASGGTAGQATQGVLVGGLIGAAAGAAIGAAVGDPGKGAVIGAAAGGIGGGAQQGYGTEETYRRAYSNCLRNRGHRVVN